MNCVPGFAHGFELSAMKYGCHSLFILNVFTPVSPEWLFD